MKSITLGCFSMPVAVLIKTCKHQGPGVCLALFFFPGYSECGVAERFTSSPTCLLALSALAEAHPAVQSVHQKPQGTQRDLTHGSVTPGAAGGGTAPVSEWVSATNPAQGRAQLLPVPAPSRHSRNCSQPQQELPQTNVGKGFSSLRPPCSQCTASTKPQRAALEVLEKQRSQTPVKNWILTHYFSNSFTLRYFFSAKDMLYFLNINEYINIFPLCPCLTKCHLLATTVYYSLLFSISDNIFCISDYLIGIFLPSKIKQKFKTFTQCRSSFR